MGKVPTIDHLLAWYEFRWLAAVGMIAFLIASALGSPIMMMAGMMIWAGFSVLARRFLRQNGGRTTSFDVDAPPRRDAERSLLNGQVSARQSAIEFGADPASRATRSSPGS